VVMDLPGHAFTDTPPPAQLSLPGMACAVAALVGALGLEVSLLVGHSAGAAIGARLVLDGQLAPGALVAVNGAFLPLAGLAGLLFPPVARLMAGTAIAPQLFARRRWDRPAVERLIASTGSTLDAPGLQLYGTLMRNAAHATGALGMMARWDLRPLATGLSGLKLPLALVVGDDDRAVPPQQAQRVRALLPATSPSRLYRVPGAGHLVHEERPALVARHIFDALGIDQGMPA
jgi:magnesium chelatase accessory protein